jgi:DNA polymerase type B, organellar and viral
MRYAHILKDNNVSEYPQQAIWFDTETRFEVDKNDTTYHHLKFGFACYMRRARNGIWGNEEWLHFTTRSEFWDWVVNHVRDSTKLYLFCHNTSFDLPVLDVFKEVPARGFTLRSAIIDAPPTILRFRRSVDNQGREWSTLIPLEKTHNRNHSQCLMILDTLNIWRMPLKFIGEEIGLDKLKMPEDNDLGVDWETYGKRDVEIIRDACIKWWKFLEDNDFGSFAPTLAGQAMRVYRHKYMSHKILIDNNARALQLTRSGYHGARCECFRIGKYKGNFTLFDVNSMYPSVMANKEYPYRLLTHTSYASVSDLTTWLKQYCVTARVLLRTDVPFAPVKSQGKLIFPVGEFECVLNTPEIQTAIKISDIVKIFEVAIYEKAFLFTEMMHDLYFRRITSKRKGDRVGAFMYRKIMNSFYGKWGQSGGKWEDLDNIEDLTCKHWLEYDHVKDKIIAHRQLGGLVQERVIYTGARKKCGNILVPETIPEYNEEAESRDSFPAIAAHITAHARMELWNIINLAGIENVFYCDTDSVLVNDIGARNLAFMTDQEVMGKLSIKGVYPSIEIWGAKDYRFGDIAKTKGVRKDAIWLDDHNVQQTRWSGLRGLIASGETDKPITKTIKKHLNRLYDKGVVLADGTVLPHSLPEIELR